MDKAAEGSRLLLQEEGGDGDRQRLLMLPQDADLITGDGSVDIKGRPAPKHTTGNWRACFSILASNIYRYQKPGGSPLARVCQVVVAAFRKRHAELPNDMSLLYEVDGQTSAIEGSRKLEHTNELKFLDRAAIISSADVKSESSTDPWKLCTVTQVEELKILVRMFPIWATTIIFSAVYAQNSSLYVEQGMVLDKRLGSFNIPPASLSTFDVISVIIWIPLYDRILVPIARKFTGREKGFSELQRIGIGLVLSILAMVSAAFVELKRLEVARSEGLIHEKVDVPMSILWQIPQYFLVGAAEVFTAIGQVDFFYDQGPDAMRSLCSAFALVTVSVGDYDVGLITGDGTVDIRGHPASKHTTGNWRACFSILGNEFCERLAYYGIAKNLISYLKGLAILTLSESVPQLQPPTCSGTACPEAGLLQYGVFFIGLYMIALGTGGIKPCVSSFRADQFDDTDPAERAKKGSFFNWFYFCINMGSFISGTIIVWIQDNSGWGIGFSIPTISMALAIASFFAASDMYRFQKPGWEPTQKSVSGGCSSIPFLDRAAIVSSADLKSASTDPWKLCTVTQVEELKILIRMFPIWATTIIFFAVYAQNSSLFVEQGTVLDKRVGSFNIPPASLSTFDVISVIIWVPLYDRILPMARKFTGREKGFSELQRMGIGLVLSILAMVSAALVELKRLEIARSKGLIHEKADVPMSILWQIPQYFLVGAAELFAVIGQLELFYDQGPDAMRSFCSAFALLTGSMGSYG
ncbi:protein NRT1/ PTR FAMILY 8.3-like isoform X1 [Panicum miliaceum]|uniref:Protein NRT1/ PTR FAMILY 8.3-like isoform X1 n=1 Tax=Panicum miliaceum TaxID=4540 RepID=A0A3L6SB04_PANMI|nr:protein NRT1/ PTR FAMILY 8.3-like isoform X1 [Panicum miliaceum]